VVVLGDDVFEDQILDVMCY